MSFAVNPYIGCTHACSFCYARFLTKYVGAEEPWGEFLYPKINIVDLLKKDLRKVRGKRVVFSSATDAYQPEEDKFGLTRVCLEALSGSDCELSVLTKSALVVRDVDIIKRFNDPTVGFSISYHDNRVMRLFERSTSSVEGRLDAMKKLKAKGVRTWAFISPLLPFITAYEAIIELVAPFVDSISASAFNPYYSTHEKMRGSYRQLGINFDKVLKVTADPMYWDNVEKGLSSICSKKGIQFGGLYRHKNVCSQESGK